ELKELDEKVDKLGRDLRQEMNKQKLDILDAVDVKLARLKGDLVVLMRTEDKKVSRWLKF
ncbi:MAG: hypothetical protein HZC05_04320, partial [Candidatus Magasanikbacteria bacterium]|nr:hypothetical protein [Candidatus Magasanikbacteria bacterium]